MLDEDTVMGIDLAGVETNPTGVCVLRGNEVETCHLLTDTEILRFTDEIRPFLIGIDAPLSLPRGRRSIHDRTDNHLRDCDRELTRHGIRYFPVTLGPMRKLTERGLLLKKHLLELEIDSFEIYPGGAQDIFGIPRKQKGLDLLRAGLEGLGIKGLHAEMSDHELDAVTGAFVIQAYVNDKARGWGDPDEGVIVMPDVNPT